VADTSPEHIEQRTGVPAKTTRRLAASFRTAARAACYGRVGLCTQQDGTLACWLAQVLNLVTGHLDEEAGLLLISPAIDAVAIMSWFGMRGSYGRWRSRVRKLPEFSGALPVATLADEIDTDGRDRIRALITIAGNPVLSAPNGARLDRALSRLEHVV